MINHPGSPRQGNTFHEDFDPFNDRLSRDIRNTLSEAFVDSLADMAPTGYQTVAAKWLAGKAAAGYIKYIQDLLRRYSYRLTFITNLDVLIKRLENSDPVSPKLENPALLQGQL